MSTAGEKTASTGLKNKQTIGQFNQNQITDAAFNDIVDYKRQLVRNLKVEEQVKTSQLGLNLANTLLTKEKIATQPYERKKIAAMINLLAHNATGAELDAGAELFGLKFGTYGKSKGMFYKGNEMKNIDQIMRAIS